MSSPLKRILALAAAVLISPLGLILLWLQPFKKGLALRIGEVAVRLAVSVVLLVLTFAYLSALGLVHMEMAGGVWSQPFLSLHSADDDQKALETHRGEQHGLEHDPTAVTPDAGAAPIETASPPATTVASGPAWTDFRGPNREGHYTEGTIRTSFPKEGPERLWRQPTGGGYASFVIANGHAFTIEQRRNKEVVAAYDVQTGRELWTQGWQSLFSEAMGGDGPRATPVWDSGRIYALGASGDFVVLDAANGKRVWSKNILVENNADNVYWGMSNAPLIVEEKVIVTPGGSDGRSVVAYNKNSGERLWSALDDRAAYTSPMLMTLAGMRQIVLATATRVVGLTVEDGKLLPPMPIAA